ncbi:MAG: Stp1/IreP family PP2C-type Ser/Thr phosphatase [Lachnospiraceae bacterium]|nr:Stp1/IreP family PP2C-type Ser/Thr phosphatase [Lachnospiraceae bacterium]
MVRGINQDSIYVSASQVGPLPNLFLVADGMGGHNAGDFASRFLVEHLVEFLKGRPSGMPEIQALQEAVQAANQLLYEKAAEDIELSGMGTTLVAATYSEQVLYVANVGDSRLYVIGDEIRQITRDHSYVEEMVALGRMDRESDDYKRNKNIITRAVGTGRRVQVDFFETEIQEGETILLCSDGLSNMVEDSRIQKIVRNAPSLEAAARILIDKANANGGLDNISVVLAAPKGSGVRPC